MKLPTFFLRVGSSFCGDAKFDLGLIDYDEDFTAQSLLKSLAFSFDILFLITALRYPSQLTFTNMADTAPRNPPFRAEHLGSLLRPKELLKTRNEWEAGKLSQADLTPAEDEAVKKIVKVQRDNGFRAISDGEYRYVSGCQPLPTVQSSSGRKLI